MTPIGLMTVVQLQALYNQTMTALQTAPPAERPYLTQLRDDVSTRLTKLGASL